jgi:hypothetical protein
MNIAALLHTRAELLRQARLANLAYAYVRLADFSERIAQARLRGPVALQVADPASDRFWPTLLARGASQAVIDEHFLDEDVVELEEILRFLQAEGAEVDFDFGFEDVARRLLPVLRRELARGGVEIPERPDTAAGPQWSR